MCILASLVVAAVVLLITYSISCMRRPRNYPPGPKWLPIVGNTYELRKFASSVGGQHIAFEEWSKKYNSKLIGLKLGSEYVVVVLSYPLVRQIHTREEFEGRPNNFFLRLRTMGTRLGITCTDGPLWAEHRNFTTRHLRQAGYGRLPMEIQIQNELNELLGIILDYNGKPVWPGTFLAPSVINVLWALTAGTRIQRNDKRLDDLLDLLRRRSRLFDIAGGLLAQLPWLRFVAPEKTGYNLIKKFNMELHEFFMETINEHKATYDDDKVNDDLIYAFIKEMKEREGLKGNTFTDQQLTMTILDIFLAGAHTTSTTLDLALMMMVVRPDIQQNVIAEIKSTLGEHQLPSVNDKSTLVYVEAVLMEVQRFFHIVPLSGPRRTLKRTNLGDFTLPKNTTILMGLRAVHMDKDHWKDPHNFRPERFINDENKIINDEYFMPFGQGKRRCLGDSLAKGCLFTFFVGILQKFELKLPENEPIPSTTLQPGITLSPKPYNVEFIKR